MLSGYVGYVDRYLGRGFDLDSITAAVIGGTAFTGGRASLLGTMAGVLLVQVLSSMLLVLGLNIEVQLIVKGLVVIAGARTRCIRVSSRRREAGRVGFPGKGRASGKRGLPGRGVEMGYSESTTIRRDERCTHVSCECF